MLKIYITRHGQTQWNLEERLQGWRDAPLTDIGKKQAEALGKRLQEIDIDKVYCSPLGRTLETAKIALDGKNDIDIVLDERLKEINMGEWEGMKAEIVEEKYPEYYDMFWNSPDKYEPKTGESYHETQERVIEALDDIIENNSDETILIITHGCAGKIMLAHFEGRPLSELWNPPPLKETNLSLIEIDGEESSILMYGDTSHLEGLESEEN
ncbi:MAG: histidine phosphatase family protein [Thermoplasmatota archaeon]